MPMTRCGVANATGAAGESACLEPLTERVLARLPGAPWLWAAVWVLVPWANAALNGFVHVTVVEQAVSDVAGTAFLDRPGEATAALAREPAPGAIQVPTTPLDAFLALWSGEAPALVKIDVEGHESAVLAGMRELLEAVRPVVLVELHGDRGAVRTLEEAGYAIALVGSSGSIAEAPAGAHVLAVPPAGR